jgi:hypothetical protein
MISNEKIQSLMAELDGIHELVLKTGKEWADAKQAADRYDQLTKSIQAKLILEYRRKTIEDKKAHNMLETFARADQRYCDWVEQGLRLQGSADGLKVEYDALLNREKALITMISFSGKLVGMRI